MNFYEYEQTVQHRAWELSKNFGPYYNLAPLMELIRQADALGYAVVDKSAAEVKT